MSMFLLLHRILATSVPLDQTHGDTDAGEEDERQHHANEPAGAGHGALVHGVHGREGVVGVDVLDSAWSLESSINSHNSELVSEAWLQTLDNNRVLIQLIFCLDPGGLLQFPETKFLSF